MIELSDVLAAAERLEGVAHRTPVFSSRTLNEMTNATVFLKGENFQRAGSFKFRGAFNRISLLTADERAKGVCTISSGNHAQALALAAALSGISAEILMPEDAPTAKRKGTEGYGAKVFSYDRHSMSQLEAGRRFQAERDMMFISSHDDPLIMAGAGTAALELFVDVGELDLLLAPIGGGGGMSGYATVAKALYPRTNVVGVEPAASQLAKKSLEAGLRVENPVPRTIADGQQLTILGVNTFEVIKERVDDVAEVSDEQIVSTIEFLHERMKVVVEPSGACALAAVHSGVIDAAGKRVGVIVSGGNLGIDRLVKLLPTSGRRAVPS